MNNFSSPDGRIDWSDSSYVKTDASSSGCILAHSMDARKDTIYIIIHVNKHTACKLTDIGSDSSHDRSRQVDLEGRVAIVGTLHALHRVKQAHGDTHVGILRRFINNPGASILDKILINELL